MERKVGFTSVVVVVCLMVALMTANSVLIHNHAIAEQTNVLAQSEQNGPLEMLKQGIVLRYQAGACGLTEEAVMMLVLVDTTGDMDWDMLAAYRLWDGEPEENPFGIYDRTTDTIFKDYGRDGKIDAAIEGGGGNSICEDLPQTRFGNEVVE